MKNNYWKTSLDKECIGTDKEVKFTKTKYLSYFSYYSVE